MVAYQLVYCYDLAVCQIDQQGEMFHAYPKNELAVEVAEAVEMVHSNVHLADESCLWLMVVEVRICFDLSDVHLNCCFLFDWNCHSSVTNWNYVLNCC